jgi:AcrR family transcriptional regulator
MTRDEILEAAAQIFRQKGFHAASMNEIARAVNLKKASLYHHVSSKQEILLALLNQGLDILIARMQEVMELDIPPAEKLHRAMQCYLGALTEYRDLSTVLLMEHRSLQSDYHARHIQRRDRFEGLWHDLIREGVSQGVFQVADPSLAAKALLGVMNWMITWYRPDGALTADEIASEFGFLTRSSH